MQVNSAKEPKQGRTNVRTLCSALALFFQATTAMPAIAQVVELEDVTHAVRAPDDIVLTAGKLRFRWDAEFAKDWKAPERAATHGHVLVDDQQRVWVNTDGKAALTIFDSKGSTVRTLLPDWHGGLHGMCFDRRGEEPCLVIAHARRGEIVSTSMDGKVLWTLPWPEASALYEKAAQYHPTSVALASDGRLYVADGYGLSWIHVYDAERKYQRSFGGLGKDEGKMRTPHGLLVTKLEPASLRSADDAPEPIPVTPDSVQDETPREVLIVCDRENHRLLLCDLDGEVQRVVQGMLRRPCNIARHGDEFAIADLTGRVTLLDDRFELIGHLGEQPNPKFRATNRVARDQWKDGEFLSPHGVAYDRAGNLYVSDWSEHGRITRLERLPGK
ncbi:MAG: hypothetical protein KDC95_17685 [Planctomycetes bacterium]|nr:hypothetical protein [Planctomycetota bacterium]